MNLKHKILTLIGLISLSAVAFAQQGKIELKTVVEKETVVLTEDGGERIELVTADKVVPGDVVIYTVTYTNVADQAVENVTITNPIAAELEYVADSAFAPGASVAFSVDNGQSFAPLNALSVEDNGEQRAAEVADLTHIRWVLNDELAPGAQGFARFRARLN